VKDLFTYPEAKRDCLLARFAEFHENVVENLSSKDYLTNQEAKEHILNLPSKHCSTSGAFSRTPSLNTSQMPSLRRMETRTRTRRKGLAPLPIRTERSLTGIVSTHLALHSVRYGHSVKSLKHREIEMVPQRRLPSKKSLTLAVPTLPNRSSTPAHLLT
jgi:hypothetical protein